MDIVWDAAASLTVRGINALEDFSVSIDPRPATYAGIAGALTEKDVTYTTTQGDFTDTNFQVVVSDSPILPGHHFNNLTPAICDVDSTGYVSRRADGDAVIDVVTNIGTRRVKQALSRAGGTIIRDSVAAWAPGSLARYLTDQTRAILAASIPGPGSQRAFSAGDGSGGLNPGLMLRQSAPGFTPLSAGLDNVLAGQPEYWISPHHTITSAHILGVGRYSNYFRMLDGSPVVAAQPGTQLLVPGSGQTIAYNRWLRVIADDVAVSYYATPFSGGAGSITKLLPADWAAYLPTFSSIARIPVWCRRYWSTSTTDHYWVQPLDMISAGLVGYARPSDPLAATFYCQAPNGAQSPVTGGDSGSPFFLGINGEAVLLGATNFTTSSINYGSILTDINNAMQDMARNAGDAAWASYSATTVNLSGFSRYG